MKKKVYLVIIWAIISFLLLCLAASLVSMANTLFNGLGMILAIAVIIISVETRLFTRFVKEKKQVEYKGRDLCDLKDTLEDEESESSEPLSDIVEVEPVEETEISSVESTTITEVKKKRKRKRRRKKKNEVQEQAKESGSEN